MSATGWTGPHTVPGSTRLRCVEYRADDGTVIELITRWQSLPNKAYAGWYVARARIVIDEVPEFGAWRNVLRPVYVPARGQYSCDRLRAVEADAIACFDPAAFVAAKAAE